jgi:hypothetical protein
MDGLRRSPPINPSGDTEMNLMSKLWQDEAGVIVSSEIILILMLLVFGMIAGLVSLRDQATQELADTGTMIGTLNQSYAFTGNTNTVEGSTANAETPASAFADTQDNNDTPTAAAATPEGISLILPAAAGE